MNWSEYKRTVTALTPDELEAIRKRAEAATAGPWDVDVPIEYCDKCGGHAFEIVESNVFFSPIVAETSSEKDAEFIANARQDVPALLAEIERLTQSLEVARSWWEYHAKEHERWVYKYFDREDE
jgi:hypothetical protein